MVTLLRTAALAAFLFMALAGTAQQDTCSHTLVDITLVPNQQNQLEIWLKTEDDYDLNFSSISFTIRWMDADGASLGAITLTPPFTGLGTSGPEHVDGVYRYQIYSSTTSVLFQDYPEEFLAGESMLYAKIDIIGSSYFELADDAFTAANNGLYYVSLGGSPCTGEIYTFSTDVLLAGTAAPEITVAPNPSAGHSTINVVLSGTADLNFELFDPAGRRIWQQARPARSGQHVEQLNLQHLADGVYMLQVRMDDRISTHRVVLGGGGY